MTRQASVQVEEDHVLERDHHQPGRRRDRRGEQDLPSPERAGITPWWVTTRRERPGQDRVNRSGHDGSLRTYG